MLLAFQSNLFALSIIVYKADTLQRTTLQRTRVTAADAGSRRRCTHGEFSVGDDFVSEWSLPVKYNDESTYILDWDLDN